MKLNITLDSQQLYTFGICPLQWYYSYKESIRLATTDQKVAADKGTLVHYLMDLYYTERATKPSESRLLHASNICQRFLSEKKTLELFPTSDLITDDNFGLDTFLCDRFMLYVHRYLNDDFKPLIVNGKPGIEVGFSKLLYEDDSVRFILEGRIDLLVDLAGGAWVDHKSEGKYNPLYFYKVQFRTYALATGYMFGLINYFGMQEDKDRKLLKANKLFRRDLIAFKPEMIQEWKQKVLRIFWNVFYGLALPENEQEKYFYELKNESSCSGAFDSHPCQFTHLCEEYNWKFKQEIKEFKYKKVEPWVPWQIEVTK